MEAGGRKEVRVARWYFGGMASAGAACFTHPLDLIKVHLQTQQGKLGIVSNTVTIFHSQGFLAFYNGLSASLLRQMTYSTTRFAVYEICKQSFSTPSEPLSFIHKVVFAGLGGALGGVVGTPADMINVRMQNDIKLPASARRNYKHAVDGLFKVYATEGVHKLFSGCSMATSRAVLMNIGQISFYDQIRQMMLSSGHFKDTVDTHLLASLGAGLIATTLTQPLDVLKTRMMNAKPGQYKNLFHCFIVTARLGPFGFYKGYVPAFVRLAPQTCLTFVFFEQLRLHFGKMQYV